MDFETQAIYLEILKEELVPAMGCTEPISVAYAAALARKTLGEIPQQVTLTVSANIIKNVKSVVVPNTGGLRGLEAAVAAGIIAAVTFVICLAGVYIGKRAGGKLAGKAGILGGSILIFIGLEIFITSWF